MAGIKDIAIGNAAVIIEQATWLLNDTLKPAVGELPPDDFYRYRDIIEHAVEVLDYAIPLTEAQRALRKPLSGRAYHALTCANAACKAQMREVLNLKPKPLSEDEIDELIRSGRSGRIAEYEKWRTKINTLIDRARILFAKGQAATQYTLECYYEDDNELD